MNTDPLSIPGVVRLPLSDDQSATLGAGEWFVAIGRRDCYPPGALLCLPVDKATADAACRVAMGRARAVKIKPSNPNP